MSKEVNHAILVPPTAIAASLLKISAVDGTAFLDPSSDAAASANFLAAVANNDYVEIFDSSKRKIGGFARAAGVAESLSETELITGFTNNTSFPLDTFTSSGREISSAIEGGTESGRAYQAVTLVSGTLYKITITGYSLVSGNPPNLSLANSASLGGGAGQYDCIVSPPSTKYFTRVVATHLGYRASNGATSFSVTDTSLKAVLTPASTGITISRTPSPTGTQNFGVKDPLFNYGDTAGYMYRIISSTPYSKLIASQTPTSGTLHIATVDDGAMFFHDSINFSAYAGSDAGSTPYLLVFEDAAGKTAKGFGGAVGGGEELSDELILNNRDFATDEPAGTAWTRTDGWTISGGTANHASGTGRNLSQAVSGPAIGKLYKTVFTVTSITSGSVKIEVGGVGFSTYRSAPNTYTKYDTSPTGSLSSVFISTANSSDVLSIDNPSAKQVTDIPVTGLHLHSTRNGTDRHMLTETGFNPNTVTKVKVYRSLP